MPEEDILIQSGETSADAQSGETSADAHVGEPQASTDAPVQQEQDWKAESERWRRDYQRLERKYTKESQKWSQYQDAMRLWDYLAQNPEISQQVQALIDAYGGDPTQAMLQQHLQQFESRMHQQLAVKETEVALRQDPVFRDNEAEIREWAEAEGFDLSDPRGLRNAFRAWKGEHADKLLAEVKVTAFKEAAKAPAERKAAELSGAGVGGKREPNWKEMDDVAILNALGMSLFEDT